MNDQKPSPQQFDMRRWDHFITNPTLSIMTKPLLRPDTKIFTMGSCFAAEIRKAMVKSGYNVFPNYRGISFDPKKQILDKLPERDQLQHYDTFVIRQEFEAAFGVWTDRDAGFVEVRNAPVNQYLGSEVVYQEPSRKLVYGATREALKDLDDKLDMSVRDGLAESDVVVITLGLTEVWQHNITGKYFCRPPGTGYGGGLGMATFRQSTFVENYNNMRATFDLLFKHHPNKQVILTVSPVALAMTYTNQDVGTANMESKSILRAVAAQICREYPQNVTYFPSYEMATIMPWPVFQEDKRHVLPEFAERVVNTFQMAFAAKK